MREVDKLPSGHKIWVFDLMSQYLITQFGQGNVILVLADNETRRGEDRGGGLCVRRTGNGYEVNCVVPFIGYNILL